MSEAAVILLSQEAGSTRRVAYEELARSMSALGVRTTVDAIGAPLSGAFVLIDRLALEDLLATTGGEPVQSRTIVLNVDRSTVFDLLEHHGLAGAVTTLRFAQWRQDTSDDRHAGICGLRAVAEALEWPASTGSVLGSERYSYLYDPAGQGLPAELVDYLRALSRLQVDDAATPG